MRGAPPKTICVEVDKRLPPREFRCHHFFAALAGCSECRGGTTKRDSRNPFAKSRCWLGGYRRGPPRFEVTIHAIRIRQRSIASVTVRTLGPPPRVQFASKLEKLCNRGLARTIISTRSNRRFGGVRVRRPRGAKQNQRDRTNAAERVRRDRQCPVTFELIRVLTQPNGDGNQRVRTQIEAGGARPTTRMKARSTARATE
jgi:hypothetical protein